MNIKSLLINSLFFLPALAALIFSINDLYFFFDPDFTFSPPPLYWQVTGYIFLAGFVFALIAYIILLISLIHLLGNIKNKFFVWTYSFFKTYRLSIITSIILFTAGTSFLFVGFASSLFPTDDTSINRYQMIGWLSYFIKYASILVLYLLFRYYFNKKTTQIFLSFVTTISFAFATYLFTMLMLDFLPEYFLTFNLNDTKGKYIMNYDGDYWITYYAVEKKCMKNDAGKEQCNEILHKKFSSAVTESPVELTPFVDKEVRVTGSFAPLYGWFSRRKKELCIKKNFLQKECKKTTGPGYWVASPIILDSIELAK